MPMITRMKIAHPRLNLFWCMDVQDWTDDETFVSEFSPLEEEEVYELADAVGGIVETYKRYSNLADFYSNSLGTIQ